MILTHFYKIFIVLALLLLTTIGASAQVVQKLGVNTNSITDKAVLELESTTKGFLLPRMTQNQMTILSAGETPEGLIVICIDCSSAGTSEIQIYTNNSWRGLLTTTLNLDLAKNHVLLGDESGKVKAVAISGDITLNSTGVSTIGQSKVLSSMILDGTLLAADIADKAVINAKLDKTNIPLSGFGAAAAAIELGNHKLTGLAEPTDSYDAATKNYVDNGIAGMNTLASGKVYIGNSRNMATKVTLSGDVTIDNTGTSAIGTSKVLSSMIVNGEIVDADVYSDAAILGTKINPTFGNQNVSTTGTLDAGATTVTTLTSLGTLGVRGGVYFDSTLNVNQATILAGTLAVTELTTLAEATVTGTLKVTGVPADFTQIPTAPTADQGTNTKQLATTEFVVSNRPSFYSVTQVDSVATTPQSAPVVIPEMTKPSIPGTYLLLFNSQYGMTPEYNAVTTNTVTLATDVRALYTKLSTSQPTTTYSAAVAIPDASQSSLILPGVYKYGAAFSMSGTITLDAQGNSNAEFIFIVTGAFNTVAGTHLELKNGAKASNVYITAKGAVGLGANAIFNGTIVGEAAVAIGASCEVTGRMFSTGGALSFGPGTLTVPESSALITGPLNRFILFTADGAVANTGYSIYDGDIATDQGAITGFTGLPINGTIFQPGTTTVGKNRNGIATFGLYNGNELIPHSSRTRTTLNNTEDIYIQATTDILGDTEVDISVRWNIDAGEVYVKNRILTLLKVK
jgi:hypothetical protein